MSNLKARVFSALIAISIVILSLIFKGHVFFIFLCTAALIAVHELNSAFRNKGHRPNLIFGMFLVFGIMVMTMVGSRLLVESKINFSLMILSVSMLTAYVVLFFYLASHREPIDMMINFFEGFYIGVPMSMVLLMTNSVYLPLVLILPVVSDTCAFFAGSLFGKHKLAPNISPKKTWEGAIGAVLGTILAMYLLKQIFYVELSVCSAILLAVFSSILAQMGDLTASVLKRYCDIKDFGTIMPGHGGIIDRMDSIIFVVPSVFLLYLLKSMALI